MKKIYEAPQTVLIIVATQQMIATSLIEKGFNTEEVPETEQTGGNLSRQTRNQWDDEEEEEQEQW
jgi:hypothetical protein